MSKKYFHILVFAFILTLVMGLIFFNKLRQEKKLKLNKVVTTGLVKDVRIYKGVYYIYYFFEGAKNGNNNSERINIPNTTLNALRGILLDKILPVVYELGNVNNNYMLLTRKDFDKFNVPLDSNSLVVLNLIDSLSFSSR